MKEVYLLIGGNMGNRETYLQEASELISQRCGQVKASSSIFETEAWGYTDQPSFLNQALMLHTALTATELLQTILSIEEKMGRTRSLRYGPRTIDIDIMFYDDDCIDLPQLKIPHPQIPNRRFALECLADIAPGKIHPQLGQSMEALLAACTDPLTVYKFS